MNKLKNIWFIILAIGVALGAIIFLFSWRKKNKKTRSLNQQNISNSYEEGLEKDRQVLLGDWQNIVGDFNNSFNKLSKT